jgi:DNA-binding transcriptional LysR family regulator
VPLAQQIVDHFDNQSRRIARIAAGGEGTLRVASSQSTLQYLLSPAVRRFIRANGNVSLILQEGFPDYVAGEVASGRAEIGLSRETSAANKLHRQLIAHDHIGAIFRQDHPLACLKEPLRWSDLLGYPYASLGSAAELRLRDCSEPSIAKVVGAPHHSMHLGSSFASILNETRSFSICSALVFPIIMQKGHLFRPVALPSVFESICILTDPSRELSSIASRFVQCLLEVCDEEPFPHGVTIVAAPGSGLM